MVECSLSVQATGSDPYVCVVEFPSVVSGGSSGNSHVPDLGETADVCVGGKWCVNLCFLLLGCSFAKFLLFGCSSFFENFLLFGCSFL